MSVALIASVAGLAMEFGPSVLRGIGSMFGGKTAEVTEELAKSVEYVDGAVNGKEAKQKKLEQMVASMPPEALVELEQIKLELEKEQTRRLELAYQDKQTEHRETQTTIREGDKASDEYVRRTRPMMARQSWYSTVVYIVGFEGLAAFDKGDGASIEMAMLLVSLAWAYNGLRSIDKGDLFGGVKRGLNAVNPLVKKGGR